VSLG
jgi:predicted transposase YbfD/YdcC